MASTERVVVLMTPDQKAAVTRRAQAAGLSVGEYVRRRALDDDPVVVALLGELAASTAVVNAALDATMARLDAADAQSARREAEARAKAKTEFADVDPRRLMALLDAAQPVPRAGGHGGEA